MPSALTPLANITLSSSASTVTFSSISGSYRDLMVVFDGVTGNGIALRFRPNGDTANGNMVAMYGTGSTSSSTTASTMDFYYTDNATARYVGVAHIMDYSATDKHKTMLVRSGSGDSSSTNYVWTIANRWASTSAITSLTLVTSSGTIQSGSTITLYGVSA